MRRKRYSAYRGRSSLRTGLKIVAAILLILLILGIATLLFLQPYLVASSDGIHFELPFFVDSDESPAPEETVGLASAPVVVVTPQVPKQAYLHAVSLPIQAIYDGTAAEQVAAVGGNAALFDMKSDDGLLAYVSQAPLALEAKTSSGDSAVNEAIRALNGEEGLYTVARISCFKDDRLSDADRSLNILTNSGYRWTDPEGIHWSSPTDQRVRDYLTAICVELAQLGFDEILLDHAGYPTRGNLGYIKPGEAYDTDHLDQVITQFYAQAADALKPYPQVKLSIMADQDTLEEGSCALSGQRLTEMVQYAQRLWARSGETDGEKWEDQLKQAGIEDPTTSLVWVREEAGGQEESWMIPGDEANS